MALSNKLVRTCSILSLSAFIVASAGNSFLNSIAFFFNCALSPDKTSSLKARKFKSLTSNFISLDSISDKESKSLIKLSAKGPVKLEVLEKFATIPKELKKSGSLSAKNFKAAVVVDKNGAPKYFIFDTCSLWDLLCTIDTKFEEGVSSKEYVFHNPVGWLIDVIEEHLPINPQLVVKLKKGIEEAKKLGLVPFEKIKRELGLA